MILTTVPLHTIKRIGTSKPPSPAYTECSEGLNFQYCPVVIKHEWSGFAVERISTGSHTT